MTVDDAELLRRYVEDRSEAAFGELVQRHLNLVYHAALRKVGGDAHLAQDVTQTVFTNLARKAASLTRHATLVGWLHMTTRFVASEAMRTERRRQRREQEAFTMHERTDNSVADADWDKLKPVIDDALGELSDSDREAVLMRFFADMPLAEIGKKLHVADNTARMRIDRALDKLGRLLERRGVTSTSTALALVLSANASIAAPAGLAATIAGTSLISAGAAAASPALSFLQFTANSKLAAGVAAMLTILALGIATREVLVSHESSASFATNKRDYETLLSQLRDVEQRAEAVEKEAARLQKKAEDARPAQAVVVLADPATREPTWNPEAEGKAFLERHPEVKAALLAEADAKLNFSFGPLFKSLGLAPDQIEKFRAIMREVGWRSEALEPGKLYVFRTGTGMPESEVENRTRELLGEDGYRMRKEFSRTVSARTFAAQVASSLYFTETPLTVDQAQELTQVIATSPSKSDDPNATRFDWNAVVAKAKGVLLPQQLEVLAGMQAQDQLDAATRQAARSNKSPIAAGSASRSTTTP